MLSNLTVTNYFSYVKANFAFNVTVSFPLWQKVDTALTPHVRASISNIKVFVSGFIPLIFFPQGSPVCWRVDAPLSPRGCLCWQNLLLRPRFENGRSCYRVKGFVLSEANWELCTVSHFHFLSLPVSGAQPIPLHAENNLGKKKTKKKLNPGRNVGSLSSATTTGENLAKSHVQMFFPVIKQILSPLLS